MPTMVEDEKPPSPFVSSHSSFLACSRSPQTPSSNRITPSPPTRTLSLSTPCGHLPALPSHHAQFRLRFIREHRQKFQQMPIGIAEIDRCRRHPSENRD